MHSKVSALRMWVKCHRKACYACVIVEWHESHWENHRIWAINGTRTCCYNANGFERIRKHRHVRATILVAKDSLFSKNIQIQWDWPTYVFHFTILLIHQLHFSRSLYETAYFMLSSKYKWMFFVCALFALVKACTWVRCRLESLTRTKRITRREDGC